MPRQLAYGRFKTALLTRAHDRCRAQQRRYRKRSAHSEQSRARRGLPGDRTRRTCICRRRSRDSSISASASRRFARSSPAVVSCSLVVSWPQHSATVRSAAFVPDAWHGRRSRTVWIGDCRSAAADRIERRCGSPCAGDPRRAPRHRIQRPRVVGARVLNDAAQASRASAEVARHVRGYIDSLRENPTREFVAL